jgi:hypothetical protein
MKMAFFWLVSSIIIALMMEAASISETSVKFYQTTRNNDSEENLKSHSQSVVFPGGENPISHPHKVNGRIVMFMLTLACRLKTKRQNILNRMVALIAEINVLFISP